MQARALVGWLACAVIAGALGCEGKTNEAPPPGKAPRASAEGKTKAMPPAEADAAVADPAPAENPGAKEEPKDLGRRFADPAWFRKSLFPDAKSATTNRSETDANKLFTSSILFELADGATVDSCVARIEEMVKPGVPNLTTEKLEDGRMQLEGTTEHTEITIQCGAPKGPVMAFVSYRWTSDPGGEG